MAATGEECSGGAAAGSAADDDDVMIFARSGNYDTRRYIWIL